MQNKQDTDHLFILTVIKRIRESFDGATDVYTCGSCIRFAIILKEIFPNGSILYNSDHAIFLLGNRCYDITGEVERTPGHLPIEEFGINRIQDLLNLKTRIKIIN